MMKTLNTITSLVANEGVTNAVANSLTALRNAVEAQIARLDSRLDEQLNRAKYEYTRMLDERMQRAQYEQHDERSRIAKSVDDVHRNMSRVDNMLDTVTRLRTEVLNALSSADNKTQVSQSLNSLFERVDELEARAAAPCEGVAELGNDLRDAFYVLYQRVDALEARDRAK